MTVQMTSKQAQYRAELIDQKIHALTHRPNALKVLQAWLAVNLPVPTDRDDASGQIRALKGDIRTYKPTRAQALLDQLGNAGFKARLVWVKELAGADHLADLALAHHTQRIADVMPIVLDELRKALNG